MTKTSLSPAEVKRELARRKHVYFMRHVWRKPQEPFIAGLHTKATCDLIDGAMADYREGRSSFLIVKMPFRHGKSDMVSRYLPPHFIGEFPGADVMVVSYGAGLSQGFSRYARTIVQTPEYQELYPDISLDERSTAPNHWRIEAPREASVTASGIRSGMVGRGYNLGIVDDYHGSRKEAESLAYRDSVFNAFTNDFLTRRAPVSITVIVASPWHVDDLLGRVEIRQGEDPDFPDFRVVKFPAFDDAYETGTLFPERYGLDWYESQRSALGSYGTASLLQCEPVQRGGNMLKTESVVVHDSEADFPKNLKWMRVWDLAHTEKQRASEDPDWTSGSLIAIERVDREIYRVWLKDVKRARETALKRDEMIIDTAMADGPGVAVVIEASLDALDTVSSIRGRLSGQRMVRATQPSGDKVSRATMVEAAFEAGNVHVLRGPWLPAWIDELQAFPAGAHDDQVDNVTAAMHEARRHKPVKVETYR